MEDLRALVRNAIWAVRSEIRWRPGSETGHLLKRKVRSHLPLTASLDDYERIIKSVVNDDNAIVYVYRFEQRPFPAVVGTIEERQWLVMFDLDGVLESAFVVERPHRYLNRPEFELLGTMDEVIGDGKSYEAE